MNDRPTPETDAKVWSDHSEGILYEVVEASFARRLERERDKAAEDATNYYARIGELERERDEAWACCDELVVDSNAITLAKTVMRLERERDEAREVLREIAEASGFDNIGNWARNKANDALKN